MPNSDSIILDGQSFSKFSLQGNNSTVYVDEAKRRLCKVAKVAKKDGDERSNEDIKQEISMLKRLHQDGEQSSFVTLLSEHEVGGLPAFIMPFIDGVEIMTALEPARRQADNAAFRLAFLKLLEAFIFLHDKRIVHGDPSIQNVLLRRDTGEPVVIDFGSAAQIPEGETSVPARSFSCRGPVSIPPEEARFEGEGHFPLALDQDIYGIAAVAVCCAAGRIIYEAREKQLVMDPDFYPGEDISFRRLTAMYQTRWDIDFPQELDDIRGCVQLLLKQAMSLDPGNRPTANAFHQVLKDLPAGTLFFDRVAEAEKAKDRAAPVVQRSQASAVPHNYQEDLAYATGQCSM